MFSIFPPILDVDCWEMIHLLHMMDRSTRILETNIKSIELIIVNPQGSTNPPIYIKVILYSLLSGTY
jgi:hypothetical protein